MKFKDLEGRSLIVVGLGVEGSSTYRFLRGLYPTKVLGLADLATLDRLDAETRKSIEQDPNVRLHLGAGYLSDLGSYEIIIKTPGISELDHAELQQAIESGKIIQSHTALFFANCPGRIIGVTGTKGKGTTSKLIHSILKAAGFDAHLVGNIGTPPLPLLDKASDETIFIFEMSAQQLESMTESPQIAVLLNVVPDHLDHFKTFENYVRAKEQIAAHQTERDYLIYNAAYEVPRLVASRSKARLVPYSVRDRLERGCFIKENRIACNLDGRGPEPVIAIEEVAETLPEPFNLNNVLPAVAVARLLGVEPARIGEGVKQFKPLEHRFERVGAFREITFYNASIATVPEVTIEHLNALGDRVQTVLLGGHDRQIDFSELGERIVRSEIKTAILFPETGTRIWQAIRDSAAQAGKEPPESFSIERGTAAEEAMRRAVEIAYRKTEPGRVCLHSPASPSFGIFKNFKERGELFKRFVKQLGQE
ncbi:MAG TPA: UDP-N-acetylmuramoyl-L-alanine--D-glutamate ligase [Blastocatellia bacterium]|nr:UDP-N-acetylmuramoyl-L-alanine--D-glutamate ligase [Blastocatellia bacterium]